MPPPNQQPAEGQRAALSVHREVSTIPMGGAHDGKQWVYPSEQMFFNAMKRKQWTPSERDMAVVVPIHNSVNEQAWRHILRWERPYIDSGQCGQPKLLQFEGKPQELTPKARFMGWLGYKRPFDRHDWTVDRCGESVRYVIDFYGGEPDARGLPSFYLDVRPALDSVGAVKQRLQHLFSSLF
ncbi:hypothetical protein CXG81DRAFT_14414 [Caulochytrium protostelioides]|uniref:Holocytochrome c-type synthase n=1 Tax=Caulochytrium protostelioides TaxID=1555241 RepID=A0A4P9WUK2_9FUNG|nr:cytochrome c and c1 heme-lyase [Caulochytrium protostelioides]RKO99507.1 hypothetical protein CXG81DRAFT_14414 [Caulochytrium protostelioides]|eukprot:RKO99507.1 hypothetical protein CXG81DRAFT_14414 [Caulochytrium protostelioides]